MTGPLDDTANIHKVASKGKTRTVKFEFDGADTLGLSGEIVERQLLVAKRACGCDNCLAGRQDGCTYKHIRDERECWDPVDPIVPKSTEKSVVVAAETALYERLAVSLGVTKLTKLTVSFMETFLKEQKQWVMNGKKRDVARQVPFLEETTQPKKRKATGNQKKAPTDHTTASKNDDSVQRKSKRKRKMTERAAEMDISSSDAEGDYLA